MELKEFLRAVYRHRYMIGVMCLSAVITASVLSFFVAESYQSSTSVLIRPRKSVSIVPKKEELLSFPVSYFTPIKTAAKTYAEILKSRVIAERVITRMKVDKTVESEQQSLWRRGKTRIRSAIGGALILLKYGQVRKESDFERGVREVQEALSVKPTKETYLFEIQAEASTAAWATAVANTAAQVFTEYLAESEKRRIADATKVSQQKIDRAMERLEASKSAVIDFKRRHGIVSIHKETELELQLIAHLKQEWESVNTEIKGASARNTEIKRQLADFERLSKSGAILTDDPLARDLYFELAKKETKLAGLLKRYTPEHRDVKALQAEIDEIRADTQQVFGQNADKAALPNEAAHKSLTAFSTLMSDLVEVETELEELKAESDRLAATIEEKESLIERMPQNEAELARLELVSALNEESYKIVSREHQELVIAARNEGPDIEIVNEAVASLYPVKPIRIFNGMLAGVLSLLFGIGIAVLIEHMNERIRSIEEAETSLGLPVLMTIPRVNWVNGNSARQIEGGHNGFPGEKRGHKRVCAQLPVNVKRYDDFMEFSGVTVNVGMRGMGCYVNGDHRLSPNDKVELSVVLDERSREIATVEGVVLRSHKSPDPSHFSSIAIGFNNVNGALGGMINDILERRGIDFLSALPQHFKEAIRGLRSDLQFLSTKGMTSFVVTSCGPQEGKSAIVSNLALALAEANRKVVVVDGNLRTPNLHNIFGFSNEMGLSSVFSAGAQPYLREYGPGLNVLTSGPPVTDPSAALGSYQMGELLALLKWKFDAVLFDSPPVLAGPDAALLAASVDGTILVLNASTTTKSDSVRAKEILERARGTVVGVVLNNCSDKLASYYSYC
jgi:capsular exopolysaccharide synthesis family protein